MTDFETHPAGTDDLLKQLRSNTPNMSVGHAAMRHAADRIEQLEADVGMMFAKGMSHGQQVLKDIGRLVIVNSPELIELREAITRANAATAAAYEVAASVCDFYDAKRVRALATPDQTAAMDRLIAEAEARVWDKAAEIARAAFDDRPSNGRNFQWQDGYDDGTSAAKSAILAASKKGGV